MLVESSVHFLTHSAALSMSAHLENSAVALEKAMAPHSSILAWKTPWMEEPGRLQSMGSPRVGHDWATSLSLFTFMHWRRKWQPIPVFFPGESQGRENLVGCHLWGRTGWTRLKWLSSSNSSSTSGPRTGKRQFSFQSQGKAMPKNAQTTTQLHSSHMLVKQCSKFSKPGFSNTWTVNFQMFKLVLEKAEETSAGSSKKQESSRKTLISALLTMPKSLTVWMIINCGKFWERWEYQATWPVSWEICMQARKQQLELDMEQ